MDIKQAKILLQKIADTDKEALKCFYREFGGSILKTSYRVLRDNALSEDVTNEIIFKVYNTAATIAYLKNPLGYICVMAYNLALDYKRKNKDIPCEQYVFESKTDNDSEMNSIEKYSLMVF